MNIQQLRQSLKLKWVSYYYNNRSWLENIRVWGTYDGQRRPYSGFILATVSVLEPQLEQLLPFILELNNNPDQIVTALGLNFNPEEQLHLLESADCMTENEVNSESDHQTFLENQPQTPDLVVTERENKTQPVAFAAVTPNIPRQTLSNCTSPLNTIPNQEESQSQFVQPRAVATKGNQSKSLPWVSAIAQVQSKSQSIPLVTFLPTKTQSNGKFLPCKTLASKTQSKSEPVSLVAVITRKVNSKAVQSVALAKQIESKTKLTNLQKDAHSAVTPPPTSKSHHLANWIDSFCQGAGWNKEETSFIP